MSKNNPSEKKISLEKKQMYKKEKTYSITISCGFQATRKEYRDRRPLSEINHFVRNFALKLARFSTFQFYPEISRNGYWHWHGVIKILNVFRFHLEILPYLKTASVFEIDTIEDPEVWSNYMTKDMEVMEPALSALNLPYKVTPLTSTVDQ